MVANDGPAAFFVSLTMLLVLYRRWKSAAAMFAFTISLKLNTVLHAPGFIGVMSAVIS